MDTKNEITRLTLDLLKKAHTELKALALLTGKTMRDLFLEAIPHIKETNKCLLHEHIPNRETLASMKNIEEGTNVYEIDSVQELLKKAGI